MEEKKSKTRKSAKTDPVEIGETAGKAEYTEQAETAAAPDKPVKVKKSPKSAKKKQDEPAAEAAAPAEQETAEKAENREQVETAAVPEKPGKAKKSTKSVKKEQDEAATEAVTSAVQEADKAAEKPKKAAKRRKTAKAESAELAAQDGEQAANAEDAAKPEKAAEAENAAVSDKAEKADPADPAETAVKTEMAGGKETSDKAKKPKKAAKAGKTKRASKSETVENDETAETVELVETGEMAEKAEKPAKTETETAEKVKATGVVEKADKSENADQAEPVTSPAEEAELATKTERSEKAGETKAAEQTAKAGEVDKAENADRAEPVAVPVKAEKVEAAETAGNSVKAEKPEKSEKSYRVVRLLSNRIYPTYQLHAVMASSKTDLRDGLRLAALITMDWIRRRLGEHVPEVLQMAPDPEEYRNVGEDCLFPMHLDNGYVIDIEYEPSQGIWCLQITEPDLGSDPGNPLQPRPPVPGRVIQTNVEYRISGTSLECGFQILISDPEGVQNLAEVYRLAIIKRLAGHADFGLKQVTVLTPHLTELKTVEDVKRIAKLLKDGKNQMPTVIFTMVPAEEKKLASNAAAAKMDSGKGMNPLLIGKSGDADPFAAAFREGLSKGMPPLPLDKLSEVGKETALKGLGAEPLLPKMPLDVSINPKDLTGLQGKGKSARVPASAGAKGGAKANAAAEKVELQKPAYAMEDLAKSGMGYCRVYYLTLPVERLNSILGCNAAQGDIVILPPPGSDMKLEYHKYFKNKTRQTETIDRVKQMVMAYPREREMRFGNIRFLAGVREELIQRAADAMELADSADRAWANRLAAQKLDSDNKLRSLTAENTALKEQIARGKEYQARLEREKEALRQGQQREAEDLEELCREKDEEITYLKRCLDRPTVHSGIAAWVDNHFQGKLILLPRAVSELSSSKARAVDLGVICDALDFLATDYRDKRYQVITEDEMNNRCSEKYNRPFEVMPNGTMTVNAYYQEYHVPYDPPTKRSNGDRTLDCHLCWGNSSDGLLRIYFFHDDKKKVIVVGSLPTHLPIMIR